MHNLVLTPIQQILIGIFVLVVLSDYFYETYFKGPKKEEKTQARIRELKDELRIYRRASMNDLNVEETRALHDLIFFQAAGKNADYENLWKKVSTKVHTAFTDWEEKDQFKTQSKPPRNPKRPPPETTTASPQG